ncbi:ROK family protein [Myxococcus sp. CA039A]|nr:ROK family protein [Myxococcus sp. CA039A]
MEVWNLPVFGRELWELIGAPRVEADRRAGVPEDQLAEQLFPALTSALEQLVHRHSVDAVWLSGGLACLEGFEVGVEKATAALGCPVYVSESPRFAPAYAGFALVAARTPLVLDVGQTSIKCARPGVQRVFERDLHTLPRLFIGMPRPTDGHHIVAAVHFIANALRACTRNLGHLAVEGVCLALPCPLDEALVPGGCTYGWEGHASLVTDILEEAALPGGGEVLVLNDAELAAEAARLELRKHKHRRILCLTLGFGPGGALLTTSASPSE